MLVGGKGDEFRSWVDEILAKEPTHLSALRLLACHCSWKRDAEALRQALETMADTALAEGSVEDERYALSQLAMVVPQETVFADRLREINDKHGFEDNPYDEAILKYQFEDQDLLADAGPGLDLGALVGDSTSEFHAEPVSNGNGNGAKNSAPATNGKADIGNLLERNGESLPVAEPINAEPQTQLSKDLESIEFYIESGYNELAETTLKELRAEHGELPEFDQLAKRIAAAVAASGVESPQEDIPAQTIVIEDPVSSQDKRFNLDEIRSEFGLEEIDQADDDDYDTHYQMAIAYQEMGLMEDAIKEYQDAISCVGPSDGTKRFFQCSNLLGHCFMQNGMAKLALKWYNRALETANLTDDEKQGIWYEIAVAYEADGDTGNAAKYYEQVYAENVDYRNVGERIKNLMVHA
jgi:tetratricopeptide (TPR) repeat protein